MFSLLGLVCVPFTIFYLSLVRYGMGVKFESYGHHPLRGGGIGGPNVLFVHSWSGILLRHWARAKAECLGGMRFLDMRSFTLFLKPSPNPHYVLRVRLWRPDLEHSQWLAFQHFPPWPLKDDP